MTVELIFICGYRKSGTVQLLNLLDGHPDLCVYPTDITLLYAYFPKLEKGPPRIDKVVFDFFASHPILKEQVHVPSFRADFYGRMENQDFATKNVLTQLLKAYAHVTGQENKPIVLTESSIEIYAQEIKSWFPDAKFIQCIRDPRDNYLALKENLEGCYSGTDSADSLLFNLVNRCLLGFQMGKSNIIQKFEDLVLEPQLGQLLNLRPHESLKNFTVCSQITEGDPSDQKGYEQIKKGQLNDWRSQLTDYEISVIDHYFKDVMGHYGYEPDTREEDRCFHVAEFYKWWNNQYLFKDPYG